MEELSKYQQYQQQQQVQAQNNNEQFQIQYKQGEDLLTQQITRYPFQTQQVKIIESQNVDRRNLNRMDFQGVRWLEQIGQTRENWIQIRESQFQPHRQHDTPLQKYPKKDRVENEKYYSFKRFYKGLKPKYNHYQLRHTLQAFSYHDFVYFSKGGITHACTLKENLKEYNFDESLQPCCFDINTKNNIIALGGLNGGLLLQCMKSLGSTYALNITKNYSSDQKGDIINFVKFFESNNNLSVLTCQNDKLVNVFDVENIGKVKDSYEAGELVNIAKFKPFQENIIALYCDQNEVQIVDFRQKNVAQILIGHQDFGLTLDWKQDGMYLATGNQDTTVKIWDMRSSARCVHTLQGNVGNTFEVQYTGNQQHLLFIESINYVHMYDVQNDYKTYQTFELVGEMVGLSTVEDKIFVAVNAVEYSGIAELERNKEKLIYEDIYL